MFIKFFIFAFGLLAIQHTHAETVFYIDPTASRNQKTDGSLKQPFHSWKEVILKTGCTYLQKRGTTDTVDHIGYTVNNITLGAYGKGPKPLIYCKTMEAKHGISGWKRGGITVKNLEIIAPHATSAIYFNWGNGISNLIDSCIIHESQWGIRVTGKNNVNHKILHTEVYNTKDDGIFIQDVPGIEIGYCKIHNVNQNWNPPSTPQEKAGGDGIQFSRCTNWYVHHNYIDRSSSGNKFCFISNNELQDSCIVEYNTFIGPKTNGACVYFHNGNRLVVRYNRFEGPGITAIFHHSRNLWVFGNRFVNLLGGINSQNETPCRIYNNVFYKTNQILTGKNVIAENNIFQTDNQNQVVFKNVTVLTESNNHYTTGYPGIKCTKGDPMFVNPENGDFHLRPSSPCIDSGVPVGIKKDADGTLIPQGKYPDLGIFEYNQY